MSARGVRGTGPYRGRRETRVADDSVAAATESRAETSGKVRESRRVFFFSSRRRHTRLQGDWSSDVCSSDLASAALVLATVTLAGFGLRGLLQLKTWGVLALGTAGALTLALFGADVAAHGDRKSVV